MSRFQPIHIFPRIRTASLLAVALTLTVTLLAACDSAAPPVSAVPPAADADGPAQPTQADRDLAAQCTQLMQRLDGGRGTEAANYLRPAANATDAPLRSPPTANTFLAQLAGEEPCTSRQLQKARQSAGTILASLRAIDSAPARAPIKIHQRTRAIKIDGRLNDDAWRSAAPIPINILHGKHNTAPSPAVHSSVQVLWDERGLFLAFRIEDHTLHASFGGRDDLSFRWDAIEVMLLADEQELIYWELNLTVGSSLNDSRLRKNARKPGTEQDLSATLQGVEWSQTVFGTLDDDSDVDEGYVIEAFIPWQGLPPLRQPAEGTRLRGMFGYADTRSPLRYSDIRFYSDVPMVMGFHDPWAFGTWQLSGPLDER